jgi:hypothetical protein
LPIGKDFTPPAPLAGGLFFGGPAVLDTGRKTFSRYFLRYLEDKSSENTSTMLVSKDSSIVLTPTNSPKQSKEDRKLKQ